MNVSSSNYKGISTRKVKKCVDWLEKALSIIFSNTINVNGVEHGTIPSERMVLAYIMLNLVESPLTVKQSDIAATIGVEAKAVGRAVRKLVAIGAVYAAKKKNGWHYYGVNVDI